ncbi:PadR family transcriptional regulator [Corallococcus exiguus]|uniref:PadR family transcriptional regulator n=1 Tax=Corallococcus exiguus TaxID=83462 RepID=UPI00149479FC|nr:helix-turn-helix transcriptional regulator [Corallococcus exiguus]
MDNKVSIRTALLAALLSGEGYGLELADRVSTRTKGQVLLTSGSLYPTLRAMEEEGLLSSREEPDPERGGRPRRIYKLTGEGQRRALDERTIVLGLFDYIPERA